MFCSSCGQALAPGQGFCAQCGRPAAAPVPPVPGMQFQISTYASKVRALSVVWCVYAGLILLSGAAALFFADAAMAGRFGPWMHGPWAHGTMPLWFGPAVIHFAWVFTLVRVALALAAGWGLWEHAQWGRTVAIVAAFLNILKFPFGTAIGIWSLVVLMGYRNSTLYDQLP